MGIQHLPISEQERKISRPKGKEIFRPKKVEQNLNNRNQDLTVDVEGYFCFF